MRILSIPFITNRLSYIRSHPNACDFYHSLMRGAQHMVMICNSALIFVANNDIPIVLPTKIALSIEDLVMDLFLFPLLVHLLSENTPFVVNLSVKSAMILGETETKETQGETILFYRFRRMRKVPSVFLW